MTISVCIATYNGEDYIKDQVDSILSQLSSSDEIIISDNHSTDSTIDILQSFDDPRIKIFFCNTLGVVRNFENALINSTGEFIFLADQDDVWIDGKVKLMLELLNKCDLVMSNGSVVNKELIHSGNTIYDFSKPKIGLLSNILRNSFTGCCIAFNRSILEKSLPFPRATPMHDWWIALIAQAFGTVHIINEPLILYRRHDNNVSSLTSISKNSLLVKLGTRLILTFIFLARILILSLKIK